jgi:hypothetical protein
MTQVTRTEGNEEIAPPQAASTPVASHGVWRSSFIPFNVRVIGVIRNSCARHSVFFAGTFRICAIWSFFESSILFAFIKSSAEIPNFFAML